MSPRFRRFWLACAAAALMSLAPAFGVDHLMVIQEVFVGPPDDQPSNGVDKFTTADQRAQYIMMRMTAAGQNQVTNDFVRIEDKDGNILGNFGAFTATAPNTGTGCGSYPNCPALIMGTTAADNLFPCAFEKDLDGQTRVAIPARGGRACWMTGTGLVADCVAWGNYSCTLANCPGGPNTLRTGDSSSAGNTCDKNFDTPAVQATGLKYGKALQRSTFNCAAQDNSTQFALAFPKARNNQALEANNCSLTDTDTDGLIDTLDCADTGTGANTFLWPVIEVQNERVVGKPTSTISWDSQTEMQGSAVRYDMTRGTLANINGFTDDSCPTPNTSSSSAVDGAVPGSGGFYYLERAGHPSAPAGNTCRLNGTYGSGTTGTPSRDTNLLTCP